MAELDVKHRVSTAQMLGIGAGVLAFANLFLTWSSYSVKDGPGATANAFEVSYWALFAMLLAIAAAVVVALSLVDVSVPSFTWLALAGASLVLAVVAWVAMPGVRDVMKELQAQYGVTAEITDAQVAQADAIIDAGPSVGLYLGLIIALASLAGAVMARRSTAATA
ncbi:MAG: hypothetical protein ACRDQF_13615 [Thermocrispum sp.]